MISGVMGEGEHISGSDVRPMMPFTDSLSQSGDGGDQEDDYLHQECRSPSQSKSRHQESGNSDAGDEAIAGMTGGE